MITRDQLLSLFALLRNLRWMIILSLVISVLLFLPAQIQELYRLAADDYGLVTAKEFLAFAVIAVAIWLGAFQLTTESLAADVTRQRGMYRAAPIVLGALPIIAAIVGQIMARPHDVRTEEVGSIFRIENQGLVFERHVLWVLTALGVVLLALFVIFALWASAKTHAVEISRAANRVYFRPFLFFVVTVILIGLLTTAFIWLPDALPQSVGTIGVIALFTLSVVGVTVHFALLTIEQGVPWIPLVFGALFGVTSLSGCDDHELRQATVNVAGDARMSAADAFRSWLKQPTRRTEADRLGEYPVFIVTAQGGGIYAAHNAARFLAKIQDLCPGFRQHLFAISSVSGGSVGAATFAAALNADKVSLNSPASTGQTCDKIAGFLNGVTRAVELDEPGAVEQRVADILKTDFVAPLAAGFLFSDFTQLFTPISFSFFDRARFLEYSLENAGDSMLANDKNASGQTNLLRSDFQSHWAPDNSMPALFLNTTDVGSGKRVVIAPFDIDPGHPKDTDLCTLAKLNRSADGSTVTSQSLHIPLSTAAFASARFPWLTPAATVTLSNDCITAKPEARLVDGGYVENSGIETALELIRQLKKLQGTSELPNFRIYLLSLANGDFDDHGSFRFGEVMEPIRALFSTQGSRTYIALNRAADIDRLAAADVGSDVPSFPSFGRTEIAGLFYNLPLGWTLSQETGDIIALSSGRFWDCIPNATFDQSRPEQSNADCLQIKVYHLLNGDVPAAFQTLKDAKLAEAAYADQLATETPPAVKLMAEPLLACYEREWLQKRGYQRYLADVKSYEQKLAKAHQDKSPLPTPVPPYRRRYLAYFQTDQIKALLQEWDRVAETDPRILAYILGSVSYDSEDFTHTSENFWFRDVARIPGKWLQRIETNNAALVAASKPPIDVNSLLGHPRELANASFGYDKVGSGGKPNEFGNRPGTDDGWNYRLRGMYQLVGLEQYQEAQNQMKQLHQLPGLDLLTFPDALWNAKIAAKVTFAHFRLHAYQGGGTLFAMLKDPSLNWKSIRAVQTDMEHGTSDQDSVNTRSEMFLSCIGEVVQPSRIQDWVSQFKGEQQ